MVKVETFRYDVVDVFRQALADVARPLLELARTDAEAREAFLEAIRLTDELMSYEPRWRLDFYEGRTQATAGRAGARAYRRMITTWSGRRGSLNDYANRQLCGLFSGYYLKRWEAFFAGREHLEAYYEALDKNFQEHGARVSRPPLTRFAGSVQRAQALLEQVYGRWPEAFRFDTGVAWNLEGKRGEQVMTFDVSEYIRNAGTFTVDFSWTHGAHALKIAKVELFEADKLVAVDEHAGYAGVRKEHAVYTLQLQKYRTNLADYTLRVTATGDGGGNSAGTFTVQQKQ